MINFIISKVTNKNYFKAHDTRLSFVIFKVKQVTEELDILVDTL